MAYLTRGLTIDQYRVGMKFRTASRTITEADVVNFAGFSGDYNAIHTDEETARRTPFRGRIAHGMLGSAISSGLAARLGIFEGAVIALKFQSMEYRRPIRVGDTIAMDMLVTDVQANRDGSRGTVVFKTQCRNQHDKMVIRGQWELLIRGATPEEIAARGEGGAESPVATGSVDVETGVSLFVDPTATPPGT